MKAAGPRITDALPRELLAQVQADVTRLLRTASLSFRPDGTVLCPLETASSYCRAVASTPEGQARCTQSHRDLALEAIQTHQPSAATCHAGVPMVALAAVAGREVLCATTVATAGAPASKGYLALVSGSVGVAEELLAEAARSSEACPGDADTAAHLWETLHRLYTRTFQGLREANQHAGQAAHSEHRARALIHLMAAVSANRTVQEVMQALAEPFCITAGLDRCLLFAPNSRTRALELAAHAGLRPQDLAALGRPPVLLNLAVLPEPMQTHVRHGTTVHTPSGWLAEALPSLPVTPGFAPSGLLAPLCVNQTIVGIAYLDGLRSPAELLALEQDRLATLVPHAAAAVANASDLVREQRVAQTLQEGLQTPIPTQIGPYSFAHRYLPAFREEGVGGDFYDVLSLADGRVALLLGDVSGKGVEAAVHAGRAKFMVRGLTLSDPTPAILMPRLNDALCREGQIYGFITVFYAVLDTAADTMTYTLAGHEPPILHSPSRGFTVALQTRGPAAGILPGADFPEETVSLQPGDQVVVYTDGAVEARSPSGEFFGHERLKAVVKQQGARPAEEVVQAIVRALAIATEKRLSDDLALLVLRRDP